MQPLIARRILPWFGGGALIWNTSLVFFQAVLVLGYLYSHLLITRLRPKQQRLVHGALLVLALITLPIDPSSRWKPAAGDQPTLAILSLLTMTVGLPYLALSATGPLLQAWRVQAIAGDVPYRLYALSNLGSLGALLLYPAVFEPALTLHEQAIAWSAGFASFAGLCLLVAFRSAPMESLRPVKPAPDSTRVPLRHLMLWTLLAAVPSMLLLAINGFLVEDVASIPFLWVLPLSLYLLSFVLTFDSGRWYKPVLFLPLLLFAVLTMAYIWWTEAPRKPELLGAIAISCTALFVACMVFHGELARRKPHPSHLTIFYLCLAVGGCLGGAFDAILAPTVFNAGYEFPVSLGLAALLALGLFMPRPGAERSWLDILSNWRTIALTAACAGILGLLVRATHDYVRESMLTARNFYGELRVRQYNPVYDWIGYRALIHGRISHGEQYTHPARWHELTTYYCKTSGVGLAMSSRIVGVPQRAGIVGLGAGTLAAYGLPGDMYRFYEINPLVRAAAERHFTFLRDSFALIEFVEGDARLSLEKEDPQGYDVLVVDAFSGDSIPVHLLTREAVQLYFRHLAPQGIVALHISNHYLDLAPPLAAIAQQAGLAGRLVDAPDESQNGETTCYGSTWVLLARTEAVFQSHLFKGPTVKPLAPRPGFRPWTDDYAPVYTLLK